MKKYAKASLILIVLLFAALNVSAAEPYTNYTYDYAGKAQAEPSAYITKKVITGRSLGTSEFKLPADIFTAKNEKIYIADSGNNRIVILNKDFTLFGILDKAVIDGEESTFLNPQGIFVTDKNEVYVLDTDNGRILVFNEDLTFRKEMKKSNSPLLSDTFEYKPVKMTIDNAGRMYIVSLNVNQGIIELDPDGNFVSFFGAVSVTPTFMQSIRRILPIESLKAGIALSIPTEYSSVALDKNGFILGTVGIINPENFSPSLFIHRLNPSGADVLRRNGINPPMGDVQIQEDEKTGGKITSYLTDIAVRDSGIYSVLDKRMGRIFTYSFDGELMYIFGGMGSHEGQFGQPVAMDVINGDEYLVVDNKYNQIVMYAPTEYAKNITKATESFYGRDFEKAGEYWLEALKYTSKSEMVYNGVAKSEFKAQNYKSAMRYYKLAHNREGYSSAYKFYRDELTENHFMLIFAVIIFTALLCFAIFFYNKFKKKKEVKKKNKIISTIKYSIYVIFHPFKGFWDLKHEKKGTLSFSTAIVFVLVFIFILRRQVTGFLVNTNDISSINIIVQFSYVLLPFILWCISNWAITTLIDGEGSFKDIYIATAYSLVPLIILNIPMLIMSNVFTLDEMTFYYLFDVVAIIWTVVLLIFAIMTIHQFTLPKTIGSMIIAVVGMVILIAIVLLLTSLLQMLYNFIGILIKEIQMRG